jgi:signal peptidase II
MSGATDERGPGQDRVRLHRFEVGLTAAIVIVDQITKAIVRANIPLHDSVTVIPGFLNLAHVRNSGAAFGFLNAVEFPYKSAVVALVAASALMGIAFYAARVSSQDRVTRLGLAMIVGGALGNLVDRLALGSVVDFVDVVFGGWHFWAFNVADSAITLGVAAMMIDMIGLGRHVSTTS